MNDAGQIGSLLLYLLPIIVLEIGLMIAALVSLIKRPVGKVRWNNKLPWVLIVIFFNIIGPISYFIFGRTEGEPDAGSGD